MTHYVSQNVRTALQAARRVITDPKNWSPRGGGDCKTTFCILTALAYVAPNNQSLRFQCWEAIGYAIYGERNLCLGPWNDSHTHEEVLAAMAAAAEGRRYLP